MDSLEQKIKEKLSQIDATLFEKLDQKTKARLKEVEIEIYEREQESEKIIQKINGLKVTKSAIANSKYTSFTRKTLYNDKLLNQYIEYSVNLTKDYLNIKKIKNLKQQHHDLKNQYNKLLFHITEENVWELKNKKLKEEINFLIERNKRFEESLLEKERIIQVLQKKVKHNNVTQLYRE